MKKLPLDPVALIKLAADDVEKTLTQNNISIDMSNWVVGHPHGWRCSVCLAGAVMVNTLGISAPPHQSSGTFHNRADILQAQLEALDALREYDFTEFFLNIADAHKKAGRPYTAPPAELIDDLRGAYPYYHAWEGPVENKKAPVLVAALREIAYLIEEALTH